MMAESGIIPEIFRKSPPVSATYDFVDVMSGTGYVSLYAGKCVSSNVLSNYAYYSNTISTSVALAVADAKVHDVDFDVTINKPLTISGNAIVNVAYGVTQSGGTSSGRIICRIRKYSGGVESELALSSASTTISTGAGDVYGSAALDLAVTASFKKGDLLRLTVEGWGSNNNNTGTLTFGHDPKNRTYGTAAYSTLIFQCPFKVDL